MPGFFDVRTGCVAVTLQRSPGLSGVTRLIAADNCAQQSSAENCCWHEYLMDPVVLARRRSRVAKFCKSECNLEFCLK